MDGAIALMQHVRSGACADVEDIKNTLIEAWEAESISGREVGCKG